MQYLRFFCAGDIEGIEKLLSPDLSFNGPLHQFSSSESYIRSLYQDPPGHSSFTVLSVSEGENTVVVFYEYKKPDNTLLIAQHFKLRQDKICEIVLIFDTAPLKR
jgi:hypothetical protein